jgi:hypothetical protein
MLETFKSDRLHVHGILCVCVSLLYPRIVTETLCLRLAEHAGE